MNTPSATSHETLHELYELCLAAHDLFHNVIRPHDSPGVRALKSYLAERHMDHLKDLKHSLYAAGGMVRISTKLDTLPGLRAEVVQELTSLSRPMVIMGCGLVEEHMARAYERACLATDIAPAIAEVLKRHCADLEESRNFVRQVQAEHTRSQRSPATGSSMARADVAS